jgi:hypothetical protein
VSPLIFGVLADSSSALNNLSRITIAFDMPNKSIGNGFLPKKDSLKNLNGNFSSFFEKSFRAD